MTESSYQQFCPVAMATEVLGSRWTMLVVRELVSGSTRFNDLHRGVPRMSSALLSKRLKELTDAEIVKRVPSDSVQGIWEYHLTEAGRDLEAVIGALGVWGQRWVNAEASLDNLDPSLLMWDMRRNLQTDPLPRRRSVIQFVYPELPSSKGRWWLIVEGDGSVDLCSVDPGHDVDLYVTTSLRTMTSVWMGLTTVADERSAERLVLAGDRRISEEMQVWLGLSVFSGEKKRNL